MQAGPEIFLFYTLDTQGILHTEFGSIWTSPWPDENDLFLTFVIREIRKLPYENLTFFLDKLYQIFFLFFTLATEDILHAEFGSIWKSLWLDEKDLFLKFVIREFAYIHEISVWNTNFFLFIFYLLFVLHSRNPWDTPHRVWFYLNNSLTWWKKLYLKIKYWK